MSSPTQPILWQRTADALSARDFRSWMIACVASLFIASNLSIAVASLWVITMSERTWITNLGMTLVFSLVFGVVTGCFHWFVLRHHFRKAYGWIVATALGYVGMTLFQELVMPYLFSVLSDPTVWGVASFFMSESAQRMAMALGEGITVGIAQWLFLRSHRVENAAIWVLVSVGVQLLRYAVPSPVLADFVQQPDDSFLGLFEQPPVPGLYMLFQIASTSVKGIVYGFPTGLLLLDFIAQKKQQRQERTG